MEISEAFSSTLARIRKEKGLTHEKLAELAGLHPTTISLLERAKRQPSITTVFLLAEGLSVEPEELIREVNKARVNRESSDESQLGRWWSGLDLVASQNA